MITYEQANPSHWPPEVLALVRLTWRRGGRLQYVEEMMVFRGEGGGEVLGAILQAHQQQALEAHVLSGYTAVELGLPLVC